MVKPEWGAKHGCPKCGTRFYDLGKDDPVTCVNGKAIRAPRNCAAPSLICRCEEGEMVEPSGIEPLTSCMPCRRSPS